MYKVVVCGNGGLLEYVLQELQTDSNIEIHYVIHTIQEITKEHLEGSNKILLAVSWHDAEQWLEELYKAGADTVYRIPMYVKQYGKRITNGGEFLTNSYSEIVKEETDLVYMETHVIDTCNLKCRGCKHFPTSELRIVTNGLLLPRVSDALWTIMKDQYVTVDISDYPPTHEKLEEIEGELIEHGIPYGIGALIEQFRKSLCMEPVNNPEASMRRCLSAHCRFLRNGFIAKCPLPLMIDDFNQKYGEQILIKDRFNIYEETSGKELKRKLDETSDMCKYCPEQDVLIPWEKTLNNAEKSDWVVD